MSWSTSELRVRLAPLNGFKPSSKIFYWPFQGGTSLWIFYVFVLSCVCYVFVRVCLYVLCGHLLGKGWPLGSRLWCLLWVCHFPIGILGQVWYLIVSIPDLCTLTYIVIIRVAVPFKWLLLAVPWGCLQFVVVVFVDYTHLLFSMTLYPTPSPILHQIDPSERHSRRSIFHLCACTRTSFHYCWKGWTCETDVSPLYLSDTQLAASLKKLALKSE